MWKIILIGLLVLAVIGGSWDEKIEKQPWKKRTYKVLMGLSYIVTAVISVPLAAYLGEEIYLYTVVAIVAAIGCVFSAINPNLRDMYAALLICGIIAWLVTFYASAHPVIVVVVDILMLFGLIGSWEESINYMRKGLDPDVIEAENAKKKKIKRKVAFRIVKILIRFF
jgi:hypothetical protein